MLHILIRQATTYCQNNTEVISFLNSVHILHAATSSVKVRHSTTINTRIINPHRSIALYLWKQMCSTNSHLVYSLTHYSNMAWRISCMHILLLNTHEKDICIHIICLPFSPITLLTACTASYT